VPAVTAIAASLVLNPTAKALIPGSCSNTYTCGAGTPAAIDISSTLTLHAAVLSKRCARAEAHLDRASRVIARVCIAMRVVHRELPRFARPSATAVTHAGAGKQRRRRNPTGGPHPDDLVCALLLAGAGGRT
jgi:hypothetical protein